MKCPLFLHEAFLAYAYWWIHLTWNIHYQNLLGYWLSQVPIKQLQPMQTMSQMEQIQHRIFWKWCLKCPSILLKATIPLQSKQQYRYVCQYCLNWNMDKLLKWLNRFPSIWISYLLQQTPGNQISCQICNAMLTRRKSIQWFLLQPMGICKQSH